MKWWDALNSDGRTWKAVELVVVVEVVEGVETMMNGDGLVYAVFFTKNIE